MKNSVDLLRGYYGLLRRCWPDLQLWDKDYEYVRDDDRPCYFAELDGLQEGYLTTTLWEQSATVNIYYFARLRRKGYQELLERKEALSQALIGPLDIGDGVVVTAYGIDYAIDRADMVLAATFDVYLVQAAEEPEGGEPMEELEMEGLNNGDWNAND